MATYSAGSASVQIVPDFSGAQKAIGKWFASQGDLKVKVNPDLDNTDLAAMRARVESQRPDIKVGIDRKHLTKELVTAVDFITGTSAITGALRKLFDVKPILLANLAGAGAAIAGELVQGAEGLAAFAPALTAALAIPIGTAVLGSQGIVDAFSSLGGTTEADAKKLAAAMKDLAPAARDFVVQVHSLAPAFKDLRLDVQEHLFAGLGDTIRTLGEKSLPMLRGHLTGVADEINFMGKSLVDAIGSDTNLADFATTIDNVRASLHEAGVAAKPLWLAFADLATVGSGFLPGLVKGFGDLATRFADFIQTARDTGDLAAFMQKALDTTKSLLNVIGNLGSILGSIFREGSMSGQVLLSTLQALTGDLADFLKSADGSAGLHQFFAGLTDAVRTLAPGLETIVEALVTGVLPAMAAFADAVAPVVNTLLVQFAGLLEDLAPLFYPALADAVGSALGALAPLIEVFSDIATTVLPVLTDAIKRLSPLFTELAEGIGDALVTAVDNLAPLLPSLVDAIEAIAQALVPFIVTATQLAANALPPLVAVLKALAQTLEFLAPLLPTVLAAFVAYKVVGAIAKGLFLFRDAMLSTALAAQALGATRMASSLLGIGGMAEAAAVGMTGLSVGLAAIAGPMVIAAGLFTIIKGKGDAAAAAAKKLADEMGRMKLAASFGDPEAIRKLQDYQDKITDIRSKISDLKKAIADPNQQDIVGLNQEKLKALQGDLLALEQGGKAATAAYQNLRRELGPVGVAQAMVTAAQEAYNKALVDGTPREQADALLVLQNAQQRLTAATDRDNNAKKTQLQLMQEAQDKILEAANATLAAENAQARATEGMQAYKNVQANVNSTNEERAQSERDLRGEILESAAAAGRKAEADNAGKTAAEIHKASVDAQISTLQGFADQLEGPVKVGLLALIANLNDNATAAGRTKDDMDRLKLSIIGIPGEKTVTIKAPTGAQEEALRNLGYSITHLPDGNVQIRTADAQAALDAFINKRRTVQIDAVVKGGNRTGMGGVGTEFGATGHIIKKFAVGGLNPMKGGVAKIVAPNTWRVIGDRVKDDEAYIPINQAPRSKEILGVTAEAMGYSLMPNAGGNYWTPPGMSGLAGVGRSDIAGTASARDVLRSRSVLDASKAAASVAGFVNNGTVVTADLDELARKSRIGTQRALAVTGL